MKLKYVTKPVLINLLRYLDKNKVMSPHRICYSSFRSKRDMLTDFSKYYSLTDTPECYIFNLNSCYHYLVSPLVLKFCKKTFAFQDALGNPLDLNRRPQPPCFAIRKGRFRLEFGT